MTLSDLAQYLANAVALGSIYALVAIGYSVVYGIVKLMNMSHASIFMLSSFLAMWGVYRYSVPMSISFPVALIIVAIAAVIFTISMMITLAGFLLPPLILVGGVGLIIAIVVAMLAVAPLVIVWQVNRSQETGVRS